MSKTTRLMVYSAMTDEQARSRFEADARRAEHEGYVPVAESWDRTTLTVTYDRLDRLAGADPVGQSGATIGKPGPTGVFSRLWQRLSLALGT
jgi:hypothetical protein